MKVLALAVLTWCALVVGCGDKAPPIGSFDEDPNGGSAGTSSNPCVQYCSYITTEGKDCGNYNAQGRCVSNCTYYVNSPCPALWATYRQCVTKTTVSCTPAENDKLALTTEGCATEFDAFLACMSEHDAGLCH